MFGLGEGGGAAEMDLGGTNQITAMLNHSNPAKEVRLILIAFRCSSNCGDPIAPASSTNSLEKAGGGCAWLQADTIS